MLHNVRGLVRGAFATRMLCALFGGALSIVLLLVASQWLLEVAIEQFRRSTFSCLETQHVTFSIFAFRIDAFSLFGACAKACVRERARPHASERARKCQIPADFESIFVKIPQKK